MRSTQIVSPKKLVFKGNLKAPGMQALAKSVVKHKKENLLQIGKAPCQFIVQKPDVFNRGRVPGIKFDRFPGRSSSMPPRLYPQGEHYARTFFSTLGGKIMPL